MSELTACWNLIVIGGGAAGFFGAITCAEQCDGAVMILEKTSKILNKVKISGGGRCNVTHSCFEPKALSKFYPRGEKSLIGPLHRWGAQDTVDWFEARGVELKTEDDGRMFPITDSSQTIIDCLTRAAHDAHVDVRTSQSVTDIEVLEHPGKHGERYIVVTEHGERLPTKNVLIATGGTRLAAGAKLAEKVGHTLAPAVPSLFTFKIEDPLIKDLQGLSVNSAEVSIQSTKLNSTGPLLITHWGMSGPAILKLSAWGARQLHDTDYQFTLNVNWLPGEDVEETLQQLRSDQGKRQVGTRSPFPTIPKRLWSRFLEQANIASGITWAQLPKKQACTLVRLLQQGAFQVDGKSINKDEFVTCGGVLLKEINLKTMQSKLHDGLYFAGEVMDIDGITGGFNFQNAWMTGHHVGCAIAQE